MGGVCQVQDGSGEPRKMEETGCVAIKGQVKVKGETFDSIYLYFFNHPRTHTLDIIFTSKELETEDDKQT